tara:strand:+ start:19295 stop:21580 length:2286 start_codon:yes stop_codon:yes gene_type:complete
MSIISLNIYIDYKLPNEERIKEINLQVPLKIYTSDYKLIGEFGEKRRTALKFNKIPDYYIKAVLAAEDDNFFNHKGVSYLGLIRSVYRLIISGKIQGGGSTITMQVAGNYLTSREVNLFRKIKDIFLAYRLEGSYSKEEIFEFYVNRIFFGNRAYGVAAASEVYYGSALEDLNLAQWAMIASLPKAPSSINPLINPNRALARRNWVLKRMLNLGYIYQQQYDLAVRAPISAEYHGLISEVNAQYVAENIRRKMINDYGLSAYQDGYEVITTLDSRFQQSAQKSLKEGLEEYDKRHGFRDPENFIEFFPEGFIDLALEQKLSFFENQKKNIDVNEDGDYEDNFKKVFELLHGVAAPNDHFPAVVIDQKNSLIVVSRDRKLHSIEWSDNLNWARPYITENRRGKRPKTFLEILDDGDLIWIKRNKINGSIELSQIPEVQGSIVSINPETGAVKALVGGYDYFLSKFDRASQSAPLLGSNFKPFLYAAAFSEGFTPSTLINDAPIIFEDEALEDKWRPRNASGKFFGPTRLREGLLQSRNLVSIRLLRELGVEKVRSYAERFGFDKSRLPSDLSLALGTASLSPLQNAAAYAVFANGGEYIEPYFVERIKDREGRIIYQHHLEEKNKVLDPRSAFLVRDILKEASRRGTARKVSELKRNDFSGKTGTTNDAESTWFTGFNTELVTSVWVGFDNPKSLGNREFGSSIALPIWIEFIRRNLDQIPESLDFPPEGIIVVKIDRETGKPPTEGSSEGIFEYYLEEFRP